MNRWTLIALLCLSIPAHSAAHNVILFVPDGLRPSAVDATDAPTMSDIRAHGVDFANTFSMFPTFTMVNASAFATGHLPGDTGVFGNTILARAPVWLDAQHKTITPFLEYDPALRELNRQATAGTSFIDEETLIAAARRAGLATAAIGKLGPTALQTIDSLDGTGGAGPRTIVIDDATGHTQPLGDGGSPSLRLVPEVEQAIEARTGEPAVTPPRRQNGFSGSCEAPGTMAPNLVQQNWLVDVTAHDVLPRLKASGKPFLLVFWSRDPDGTQHNQGDSFGRLVPGINGPTARAAIRNADETLRRLRAAVRDLGLEADTDIVIAADHGFSTIAKESRTSGSAALRCAGLDHALPQGFLGMDIARALDLNAYDPDSGYSPIRPVSTSLSKRGQAVIGPAPDRPEVIVTANGGSDLIYLPSRDRKRLAARIVAFLLEQDYVSGLFVDDALGRLPGTMPFSAINLDGRARTIRPSILVNFRSFATGCADPTHCAAEIADTSLVQGQGMHGAFSRADTATFMAAIGPSFKAGYRDPAPASNADVARTIARILNLDVKSDGARGGRVLAESFPDGKEPPFTRKTLHGPPAKGLATTIVVQEATGVRYLEAGGFPGRTVGLPEVATAP